MSEFEDNDPFLKRWSKKKRGEVTEETEIPEDLPVEAENKGDLAEVGEAEVEAIPPDLPDIDSLAADSDFTGFLKDGVPEELKRAALRTLWKSSPELANLDGLNDYDEDYSIIGNVIETIKSAYKPGRGYEEEEPEKTEEPVEQDTVEGDSEDDQAASEEDENEIVDEDSEQSDDEDDLN